MLADCRSAEDVRNLAKRQAEWRRSQYAPKPRQEAPKEICIEIKATLTQEVAPAWVIGDSRFGAINIPAPEYIPKIVENSIRRIQKAVCETLGISLTEMVSDRRTAPVVFRRQIAMYLCKKLTTHSLPEIGRRFGKRDHTTVLHAVRKIERKRQDDAGLDDMLKAFESELAL